MHAEAPLPAPASLRLLSLVPDAFGGRGGIAQYTRDVLTALAGTPGVEEIVVVPRVMRHEIQPIPSGIRYLPEAAGGKVAFLHALGRVFRERKPFDAVLCGHIRLLPLAAPVAWMLGKPLVLFVYGIDAWKPERLSPWLVRAVDHVVSISDFTTERFLRWAALPAASAHKLPCCVHPEQFDGAGDGGELRQRLGLENRTVVLTLARLASSEKYKGVDETMEALPAVAARTPNVTYVIAGDGDDRARLEAKAKALGVADRVVFTGYVREEDKPDLYRLADCFCMPGRGEGFGIVYLEALACGVPVIGSLADASRETLLDGRLGRVVDPDDRAGLADAICETLAQGGAGPQKAETLAHYGFSAFSERVGQLLTRLVQPPLVEIRPQTSVA